MNNLKLHNCFIAVHDHDEALAFYRDLLGRTPTHPRPTAR